MDIRNNENRSKNAIAIKKNLLNIFNKRIFNSKKNFDKNYSKQKD